MNVATDWQYIASKSQRSKTLKHMSFLYQGSEQLSQNKYSPTKAKHFESDKGITKQTPNKEKHPQSQNQTLGTN